MTPTFRQLLRAGSNALAAKFSPSRRRPLGLYVHLTEDCGGNCRYCEFPRRPAGTAARTLDAGWLCRLLPEFAAAGTVKLNLTGGEPLLVPGLPEIIRTARACGMYTVVSTSGLFPDRWSLVRDADLLMISYDGRQPAHEAGRGSGTHARVSAFIAGCRAAGIRFWTTTVVHRLNAGEIPHILAAARQWRSVANFTLLQHLPAANPHIVLPATGQVADLIMPPEEIRRVVGELLAAKRAGEPVGSTPRYLELLLRWPDFNQLFSPEEFGFTCQAGRLYGHLYADGQLYACGHCIGVVPGQPLSPGGVARTFAALPRLPHCRCCRVACDVENSLIYSLDPATIWNWLTRL